MPQGACARRELALPSVPHDQVHRITSVQKGCRSQRKECPSSVQHSSGYEGLRTMHATSEKSNTIPCLLRCSTRSFNAWHCRHTCEKAQPCVLPAPAPVPIIAPAYLTFASRAVPVPAPAPAPMACPIGQYMVGLLKHIMSII